MQNIVVREATNAIALLPEPGLAFLIIVSSLTVTLAVKLDDQSLRSAEIINDKPSNRSLSYKLQSSQLAISQQLPKSLFGICHSRP